MTFAFRRMATLGKFTISLPIALTCYIAYVLFDNQLSWLGAYAAIGIFCMSAGASALNQLQEFRRDTLMNRTRQRPIPIGAINKTQAIAIISLFLIVGSLVLYSFGMNTVLWGWMGVIWYNLIYTPLKTRTAFSVFPGAMVGAIPPIAGWVAAGGSWLDYQIHFIAFFFFLGQMPHFWLLVLKYRKQYKEAGFPLITDYLKSKQVIRINLVWFIATFISVLFLPILKILSNNIVSWIALISAILMIAWSINSTQQFIKTNSNNHLRKQFIYFNSFYLWVMLLMLADQL
ncbi:protoheme IX farnesyltransferase [Carboxylicivirga marina]|uniref:heme o synthase n=1 Tax=Carboxylicivirga marina TaxID=2800988 RepID=A0ABS1HFM9_9BACT|nr:protoheme IX farnesyltransferase [Carboxylicivirga marina]MBK3516453.1 protoheme IX farnesyltransferase [Carboxylicivirga marina]